MYILNNKLLFLSPFHEKGSISYINILLFILSIIIFNTSISLSIYLILYFIFGKLYSINSELSDIVVNSTYEYWANVRREKFIKNVMKLKYAFYTISFLMISGYFYMFLSANENNNAIISKISMVFLIIFILFIIQEYHKRNLKLYH